MSSNLVDKMFFCSAVHYLLLIIFVIFKISAKSECLNIEVETGEKLEQNNEIDKNINSISRTLEDYEYLHTKVFSSDEYRFSSRENQDNALYNEDTKKCRNKLCVVFKRHRLIRQTQTDSPFNSRQSLYRQYQKDTTHSSSEILLNNTFGKLSHVYNYSYVFDNNTTQLQTRPRYNSTVNQFVGNNNLSYSSPWSSLTYPQQQTNTTYHRDLVIKQPNNPSGNF